MLFRSLETALHQELRNYEVNRVNHRKEFFQVPLEEIENAVNKITGKQLEFTRIVESREFRETQLLIEKENTSSSMEEKLEESFPAEL